MACCEALLLFFLVFFLLDDEEKIAVFTGFPDSFPPYHLPFNSSFFLLFFPFISFSSLFMHGEVLDNYDIVFSFFFYFLSHCHFGYIFKDLQVQEELSPRQFIVMLDAVGKL